METSSEKEWVDFKNNPAKLDSGEQILFKQLEHFKQGGAEKSTPHSVGKLQHAFDKQDFFNLMQGMHVDSIHTGMELPKEVQSVVDMESLVLNQVVFQVSKATIPMEIANSTQFVVKLYPQELGDMIAELHKTEDGISLRLFVESFAVKEMLESNMQSFEEQLSQSDIPFSQIDVELGDFSKNTSQDNQLSNMDIWDAHVYKRFVGDTSSVRNTRFDKNVWENRFSASFQHVDTILELFA